MALRFSKHTRLLAAVGRSSPPRGYRAPGAGGGQGLSCCREPTRQGCSVGLRLSGRSLSCLLHRVRVGQGGSWTCILISCRDFLLWPPSQVEGCWPCALRRGAGEHPHSPASPRQGYQVSPSEPQVLKVVSPQPAVCDFVIQVIGSFTLKPRLFKKGKKKTFGDQMKTLSNC